MNRKSCVSKIILCIFFFIFYLPIIKIIFESFVINDDFTLEAYRNLFEDTSIIQGFLHSIFIGIITVIVVIKISLSTIKYFFLNGSQKIFLLFNILNLVIPETILAIALLLFFSYLNITLGVTTLIIAHIAFITSYTIPLLYQKWLEVNTLYITAAQDLGAHKNYIWKSIVIKLLEPTIISISFLSFILSFDDYIFSYFCAGIDTATIATPLLTLLHNGLTPKVKALFSCIMLFSFIICIVYLVYIGIKNGKKNENY